MKQNITVSIDKQLLKRARAVAAQRGASVSSMLAGELQKIVASETAYEQAKVKALVHLRSPFRLGGRAMISRDALHDRKNLR